MKIFCGQQPSRVFKWRDWRRSAGHYCFSFGYLPYNYKERSIYIFAERWSNLPWIVTLSNKNRSKDLSSNPVYSIISPPPPPPQRVYNCSKIFPINGTLLGAERDYIREVGETRTTNKISVKTRAALYIHVIYCTIEQIFPCSSQSI